MKEFFWIKWPVEYYQKTYYEIDQEKINLPK